MLSPGSLDFHFVYQRHLEEGGEGHFNLRDHPPHRRRRGQQLCRPEPHRRMPQLRQQRLGIIRPALPLLPLGVDVGRATELAASRSASASPRSCGGAALERSEAGQVRSSATAGMKGARTSLGT